MLSVSLEQERMLIAERLLTEIERRHGLPHPHHREIPPVIIERFLAAYLPGAREGTPAPLALEYAFAPSLTEALQVLRDVVQDSSDGRSHWYDVRVRVSRATGAAHTDTPPAAPVRAGMPS